MKELYFLPHLKVISAGYLFRVSFIFIFTHDLRVMNLFYNKWTNSSEGLLELSLNYISYPKCGCGCGMRNSFHILVSVLGAGAGAGAGAEKF